MKERSEVERKESKNIWYILGVLNIIIVGIILIMLINVTNVKEPKLQLLDSRERNKQEAVELVEGYITTVDKAGWELRRGTERYTKEVLQQLYGTTFESFKLPEITAYKFNDVQYTINGTTNYKMYVSTILEKDGNKGLKVFILSIENDEIVHIEVY